MNRLFLLFSGIVQVLISGDDLPRFLNLCRIRNLYMKNIHFQNECLMEGTLPAHEFYKLLSIRRKSHVHIHIIKKQGFPFFLHNICRKKSFLLGIFLGLFLLLFLSSRVWTISINGNSRNSTVELQLFLNKKGISPGIQRKKINCSQISDLLRQNYADITWVSTKLQGTSLNISVREGLQKESSADPSSTYNIVAEKDGKIVSMVTRKGTPLKKQGDLCKAGEILVLGEVEIKNDAQEIVRIENTAADADILIEHNLSYFSEFQLHAQQEIQKKQKGTGFSMQFGQWYIESFSFPWPLSNPFQKTEYTESSKSTHHTLEYKSSFLPFSIWKTEMLSYQTEEFLYTQEEAQAMAEKKLEEYEKKLIEKGVQISANNVTIRVNDFICQSKGSLTVIEKTGRPQNKEK